MDDLTSVGSKGLNQDCEVLFHAGMKRTMKRIGQQPVGSQQQQQDNQPQTARQSTQQEREKERREKEDKVKRRRKVEKKVRREQKGERGKEEGRNAEEEERKQVKKDVTGWTVVTRKKRQRKMVQIFVKVDEAKARWR